LRYSCARCVPTSTKLEGEKTAWQLQRIRRGKLINPPKLRRQKRWLGKKGKQLKNVEQQFVENCRGYINENPLTSLGIAVGAGFLLSRLLSGR
jgi:ElaB/YqjD/DUF883 family membrane-anchored ribosome-binding protein